MISLRQTFTETPDRFADLLDAELVSLRAGQAELRTQLDALRELLESGDTLSRLIGDAASQPPAPSRLVIDMEAVSPFVANLHPCEYSPSGAAFRWTGPGDVVKLVLHVDRSAERELKIRVMAAVSDAARAGVRLRIDGQPAEHLAREHALLVKLPPLARRQAPTELEIHLPGTASPADLHGEGDERRLGIAIAGIEVG